MNSFLDSCCVVAERALRTLNLQVRSQRKYPVQESALVIPMSTLQCQESAALMRINHAGEVCAQALYEGQALGTRTASLREAFKHAAEEERDHLAWTTQRIHELGGRVSVLAPVWYAGSFAIGLAVSRLGDATSLGFMAETERQVEQHLQSHLGQLPAEDTASRQVVLQMQADEAAHRVTATELGGSEIPPLGRTLMRAAAKVMTTLAYRL